MTTVRGIDYAWQHPDPKAIKAAGFDFVCRYYSRDPSKNLTRAEADALAAAGLWIVGNWEYGAEDALRGYAGGVSDATLARQQADACGQPRSRPTYFSKDWDVTPEQEATVTDYDRGADSVLGVAQVGDYAGFYPLRVQRDAGVISWEWQPTAWSGGQWEPRVNVRQIGTTVIGGLEVDVNEAMTADYGQWQPGRLPFQPGPPPVQPLQEHSMITFLVAQGPNGENPGIVAAIEGIGLVHVSDIPDQSQFLAHGVQQVPIDYAQYVAIKARDDANRAVGSTVTLTDAQVQALGAAIAAGIKLPTTVTLTGSETVTGKLA